jgi:hypothetical protein
MPKTIFNKMDETQWQRFLSNALIFFKDFEPGQLKKTACVTFELRFHKNALHQYQDCGPFVCLSLLAAVTLFFTH